MPFLLVLSNCQSTSTTSQNSSTETDTGTDTSSELTLTSCTTIIDDAAADFYQTYFKCVTIARNDDITELSSTNLPPHRSYYYGEDSPNYEAFDYSRGDEYAPNPNSIEENPFTIIIPDNPVAKGLTISEDLVDGIVGTSDDEYQLGAQGIALDSIAIFNPLAAPGDDIEDEQYTFDSYNSHPTDTGFYHYHTVSPGPLEVLELAGMVTTTEPGAAEIEIYGIMCDGTVVLGCTELDGGEVDTADFDAQNGHVHDIIDGDNVTLFSNRYHTHICSDIFENHQFTPEIQYYESCEVE